MREQSAPSLLVGRAWLVSPGEWGKQGGTAPPLHNVATRRSAPTRCTGLLPSAAFAGVGALATLAASCAAACWTHLDDQVALVGGHALHVAGQRVRSRRARQLLKAHVVPQVDDVEEGGKVMIAVLATAHDAQEQVDLRAWRAAGLTNVGAASGTLPGRACHKRFRFVAERTEIKAMNRGRRLAAALGDMGAGEHAWAAAVHELVALKTARGDRKRVVITLDGEKRCSVLPLSPPTAAEQTRVRRRAATAAAGRARRCWFAACQLLARCCNTVVCMAAEV